MNLASKILFSGLALALATASLVQYSYDGIERARARRLLLDTGLEERLPEVAKKTERDTDPEWAKISIVRALLAEHIDQRWLLNVAPQERQQEILRMWERLHLARELSAEVYSFRPATWQAAMVLGGATMLDGARSGAAGLLSTSEDWERPLRTAIELAPGQEEPCRLLAGAYLGIWPRLPEKRKRELRAVLARAFEDATTFRLFAEPWLRVAEDRDDAFTLVPDRSSAWLVVKNIYNRRADWQGFAEAFQRWDRALLAELELDLNEAETRLLGGDVRTARFLMLSVVRRSRLDTRYMKIISRSLIRCPPGPPTARLSQDLSRLLDWALERVVLGKSSLEPAALQRLAGAVAEKSSEQKALVALAIDDLPGAALHERREEGMNTESWAPYMLLKARKLTEENDIEAAQAALNEVHWSWRGTAVEADIRRHIAEKAAAGQAITGPGEPSSRWRATEWRWRGNIAQLYMIPATRGHRVQIHFDVVPAGGRPVEIRWDQESRLVALASSEQALELNLKVTPELHTLEVESLTPRRVVPGLVRLVK
jgi:hypothetical protein